MQSRFGLFSLVSLAVVAVAGESVAQTAPINRADAPPAQADRFKWSLGLQGGGLLFSTQRQTQSGIPAAGAHVSVTSRRAGVSLGFEEGFGSNEPSAFYDESDASTRDVVFDRIRRFGVNLLGYPAGTAVGPYFGLGFGMIQVVRPEFDESEVFTSPSELAEAAAIMRERAASAFASFLAGLQFRLGRLAAFAQYQINTSPRAGDLLRGTGHSVLGGVRFSLGSGGM